MHAFTKKYVTEILPAKHPLDFAAFYPRRITPPGGYLNPKYFAGVLSNELVCACGPSETEMLPHLTGVINCFKQLEHSVPTFFVRSEFAQAVAQTSPPKDFKLSEIKWPLDAMLFVLPTDFSLKYFGFFVPFLSICRAPVGVYPDCVKLPPLDHPRWMIKRLSNQADRFVLVAPCYSDFEAPMDYTATFNMDQNVGDIPDAPYEDATFMEDKLYDLERTNVPDFPTGDAERLFHDKLIMFGIKLMLALTVRPGIIQNGTVTRKASVTKAKHPKAIDALWSPNTIGWEYRAERQVTTPGGGSHASPRMHWRKGHFTNQAYGEKMSLRKLMWILPILVNAPEA